MHSTARRLYGCNKPHLSGRVTRIQTKETFALPSQLSFEEPQGFCRMSCKTLGRVLPKERVSDRKEEEMLW